MEPIPAVERFGWGPVQIFGEEVRNGLGALIRRGTPMSPRALLDRVIRIANTTETASDISELITGNVSAHVELEMAGQPVDLRDMVSAALRTTLRQRLATIVESRKAANEIIEQKSIRRLSNEIGDMLGRVVIAPVITQAGADLRYRETIIPEDIHAACDYAVLYLLLPDSRIKLGHCQLKQCDQFYLVEPAGRGRPPLAYCKKEHRILANEQDAPRRVREWRRRRSEIPSETSRGSKK